MLTRVNATNLALIPKSEHLVSVVDFRPIACCNITYKCISKIIVSRLKNVLPFLISENHAAFLLHRNNVLLTHELLKDYKRTGVSLRDMLKLDIRKAYDTLQWTSISKVLSRMNIPAHFSSWIYTCLSTIHFSLCYVVLLLDTSRATKGSGREILCLPNYLFWLWKC